MKAGWCRYEHASLTAPILPAADINVLSQYVSAGLTDEGGNRNLPPDLQGYTTLNQCHAVPITGSCAPNVPRGERWGRGDTASPEPLAGRPRRHRRRPAAGGWCRLQDRKSVV